MVDAATALTELIKNAYDADATFVMVEINTQQKNSFPNLHFHTAVNGYITIQDNGKGMSWDHVQQHWMTSTNAVKQIRVESTTERERSPLGGTGVGRLSTLWLGDYVELFTSVESTNEVTHAAFDWSHYSKGQPLASVPLFTERLAQPNQKSGTTLIIFPIKNIEQWKGGSGKEQILRLEEKVFSFVDRTSFRVIVKLDNQEFVLGDRQREHGENRQVFIENVWQKMSPASQEEVVSFWDENKMLKPGFSSEERARQVVLIIRRQQDKKIVGVSTAALVTFKQLNNNKFYLYRSIILPGYRHPGLTSKVIVETRDCLEEYSKQDLSDRCIGLLTFVENPRINQYRREAIWPASKMAFIGVDKEGRQIRVYYFRGATI